MPNIDPKVIFWLSVAIAIAGVPGLTYVPKKLITNINLPGYEAASDFIRERLSISPELALSHNIQRLRGIALAGGPGTGKTMFGMSVAKTANRMLLIWSLGETQGGIVGQTEANARRAINIIQATEAAVLVDDLDKSGASQATSGHTGDGGVFSRLINMLLTEMSSPDNRALWIFTMNRLANVPPELLRDGRVDRRFAVMSPDEITRANILRVHCDKRKMDTSNAKDAQGILDVARICEDFVGAELEALVNHGAIRALAANTDKLDWEWMTDQASGITPLRKQEVYADDIRKMEEATKDFVKVGRIQGKGTTKTGPARSGRSIGI